MASCSIAPAHPATSERWSAAKEATPRDISVISRPRITWMRSPVLMPTGHAVEHSPSPAHRSLPTRLNSRARRCAVRRALRSVAPSSSSSAISRCTTIRWRDESAKPCATHFTSQKPHSMHLSTIGSRRGRGFRLRTYDPSSSLKITPGLRMPSGSNSAFTSFIKAYAASPHSRLTNGAMFLPVPCSALSEPSYLPVTSETTSRIMPSYCATAAGESKRWLRMKCQLPSSAWP